jgi:sulfotransferase
MQFHFISGLPRAGSTLLASILRQNPAFEASIMTPVGRIITGALSNMGPENEADSFISDDARIRVLQGIFQSYYACEDDKVVFDNNRRWCANVALLDELFPTSKVICCMRSPAAVADSFEQLFQKHPLNLSVVYGSKANLTVYERMSEIMQPSGVVGFALNAFRSAFFGPHRNKLLVIEYDDLARYPAKTMEDLHTALDLPLFGYDFNCIEPIPGAKQFDLDIRTPGLHDLKPKVVYEQRASILPPDIYEHMPKPFWRGPAVKKEATLVS